MTQTGAIAAALLVALGAGGRKGAGGAASTAGAPEPVELASGASEMPLADALAELDRQNLSIEQARRRAEEARAVARQAAAALVPSLSAQGSYVRNSAGAEISVGPNPIFPSGMNVVIQPEEQFSVQGTLRVPLVVPNAWFDAAAARSSALAAGASAEATALAIRTAFAQAAYAATAAEEVVLASERATESAAAHARSAERRAAAGTAPPLDVLKAKTEEVHRESDLARARADLARARLSLGILLGRESPVRVLVPEPPPDEAPADGAALVAGALSRRPEMKAQQAQLAAADASVRSGWARLAPQLSATGSAFASDVPYPTGDRQGWRATLDVTWPIYDGGLREGRRRQAEAQRAQARAAAEAQRLAVVQDVSDGTREVAVARERLRLAETQRKLASDAAASARRSFEAGIATNLDVIDANDRLYQADVGLADARARLAQARVALDRALGR